MPTYRPGARVTFQSSSSTTGSSTTYVMADRFSMVDMGHLNSFFGDGDTIDYREPPLKARSEDKTTQTALAVSRMLGWRQTNGCVGGHGHSRGFNLKP